jgi:hypothetical protein
LEIPSWVYDQAEVLFGIAAAVLTGIVAGARWTAKIEHVVRSGFEGNHADHRRIFDSLDEGAGRMERVETKQDETTERLARVETKVDDHRQRYP